MTAATYATHAFVLITPTGYAVELETITAGYIVERARVGEFATRRKADKHAAAFNRVFIAAKAEAVEYQTKATTEG